MPQPFFIKTDHRVHIKISVCYEKITDLLKALSQNEFRGCFKEWKTHGAVCTFRCKLFRRG
jgi:hypothetical protein